MFLHEWGALQDCAGEDFSQFFAIRRSLDNPPKIACKLAVFRKLVLDTIDQAI
jgi:hypothetical protein